jgi:hypothetical protein
MTENICSTVNSQTMESVSSIVQEKEPVYPYTILEIAVTEHGIERDTGKKALHNLNMKSDVIPSRNFKGKLEFNSSENNNSREN